MSARPFITSCANPRLKRIRRLRRRPGDAFLVEGYRQVAAALEGGARLLELYAAPELFFGDDDARLVAAAEAEGADVVELSAHVFESINGQARPDGIAAVVERPPTALAHLRVPSAPLLLVAEAIERPGNLGTIVRTACAAGADGLIVADAITDPFHSETVRGSVGAIFRLPLAAAPSEDAIAWLRGRGIPIAAATPDAERSYKEAELRGAIVVGNERHGLSQAWIASADETVRIPMPGPADSLNVAVAAGVLLCEAACRREAVGSGRNSNKGEK